MAVTPVTPASAWAPTAESGTVRAAAVAAAMGKATRLMGGYSSTWGGGWQPRGLHKMVQTNAGRQWETRPLGEVFAIFRAAEPSWPDTA
ncbi:hypothetical protein GCM10020229_33010 [Kitasatospora albolonga]